jgi:hypothetical protein
MGKRLLALGPALGLVLAVLSTSPASAAYDVNITFPNGDNEFYSPFAGPASIEFANFVPSDPDTTFRVRLRPVGGSAIETRYFSIDPDTQTAPVTRSFSWDALSVQTQRDYEVVVNPNGGAVISSAVFTLDPRLVQITSIKPSPFFPWVPDGYKDTTDVTFKLAASSQPTIVRIYKATLAGKCCGSLVRDDDIGTQVVGTRHYEWDGRDTGGSLLPKGDYFVKIRAEDPANVVRWSRPVEVSIARTYRKLATLQKNGIAFHHTGPVTSYRRGGNCFVTRDETDKDLWITCLSASFTVYWRWSLPNGGRIERASFVYVKVSSSICNAKKGHTKIDSFLKVGGVGQFRCRIDKARITYSVPTPS